MNVTETELLLKGYGLTTAEFFYRMPDYQNVLNSYIWQEYDIAPDHPRLFKFIEFWQDEIEGPLHSIRFTHRKMISPGEWRNVVGEFMRFTYLNANGKIVAEGIIMAEEITDTTNTDPTFPWVVP